MRQTCGSDARIVFAAAWITAALLLGGRPALAGQVSIDPQAADAPAPQQPANVQRVSVHGIVKNTATGEPLPRALVRIEGDAEAGALTDGDGRFEIDGVPVGPQSFQLVKPGFHDASEGFSRPVHALGASTSDHDVHVTADMEELVFAMSPTNSIRGQITLSTGDPAQGIGVMLLRRSVQDGRAVWQAATNVHTNSEGVFRFAGLSDGTYIFYTEPAMDSEMAVNLVEAGSGGQISRDGFPSVFYPDARDVAGAGKIQLTGGQQAQANLQLTEEPFHLVRASVTLPSADAPMGGDSGATNVSVMVLDGQGHQLPYSAEYDRPSHSVQSFLPDGTYGFLVTAINPPKVLQINSRFSLKEASGDRQLIGETEFSVSGKPLTSLRVPLVAQRSNTIQVSLVRTNPQQSPDNGAQGNPLVVTVSQAGGWISDGMVASYAEGYLNSPLETTPMNPGLYWVHTSVPQKSVCEGSFTAGGASLANEPLALGLAGSTAPLTLTLRDDCASLRLSLPQSASGMTSGDQPSYTVYVVPDFASTADVVPITIRASLGGTAMVSGLTPGAYRVYVFTEPVEFEYRNPEALAQVSVAPQTVTLAPSDSAQLVLEVPQK